MRLNYTKELTPVIYGDSPVRILLNRIGKNDSGFLQHWHERMELHLVKSGCLKLCCDEKTITVYPGEVSIIQPGVSHAGSAEKEDTVYYVLMFDIADLSNSTVASIQYLKPILNGDVRLFPKTDSPQVVSLVEEIAEANKAQSEHPLEAVGSLYKLLGLLWEYCVEEYNAKPAASEKLSDAIRYIDTGFTKNITVSSVCEEFGYSEAYFCRKFKKATGLTAAKYIRTCRLEHAKQLLEKTNESVKKIALSCGFSVPSYFINCFRETYGISPAKYRFEFIAANKNPGRQ